MVAVAAVLAGIMLAALWSKKPQYKLIYSGVSGEDVAEVVSILEEKKVPYRLSTDGMSVSVPLEKMQEARLLVAGEGILAGGGSGFEIFDDKKIGMTEFMQKLNYQRALQGELARTISRLSEVESARVHIVMPKESLFEDRREEASASVVIKLKRGRILSQSQISGITQLVANAVEGLEAERVTIVDSRGNILSKGETGGAAEAVLSNHEIQRAFEMEMEKKVLSMLERAVGKGKSIVKVSAVMDFEQSEKVEEIFDPDRVVVRSEQRTQESRSDSEGLPEGVPGVASNLGEGGRGETPGLSSSNKKSETINYEITRVTKKTVSPMGKVQRISVAVLIDGNYETADNGERRYVPRSPEELKTFENLVKRVVGFDSERGDRLEIASVPFEEVGPEVVAAAVSFGDKYGFWISIARNVSIAVAGLLFFLLVLRPLVKWLVTPVESGPLLEGGTTAAEMEHALLEQRRTEERTRTMESIITTARNEPEVVYNVVRGWLAEDRGGGD